MSSDVYSIGRHRPQRADCVALPTSRYCAIEYTALAGMFEIRALNRSIRAVSGIYVWPLRSRYLEYCTILIILWAKLFQYMATNTHSTRFDYEWNYSPRTSTLFGIFTGVAVFGWLVSVFLSGIHFWAIPQIPAGAEISGSLEVITSQWAYVFGVPLATLGALYYLTTIALAAWWFDTRHPLVVKILTPITASGVLASSYFVWLQLVPIGEICPFCMMSAGATVVLFALELAILRTSELPKTGQMMPDLSGLLAETTLRWPLLIVAVGALTLAAFYGVTLAPVPGTV